MIESDSASRRDDGSAFGWASRCGVVRESTKEAVDSDEMPGPPSTRERKAVLYTRKQLEVLQRRADEQQLTIERMVEDNNKLLVVVKQHELDNDKRARYQREREREHAREIDKLHRQGRLELSAAAQSRRLREASIVMMEQEISRLSRMLAKKHPGKEIAGLAHVPLLSAIRAEYESANETLRLRVIELEHALVDRSHEVTRAGPAASSAQTQSEAPSAESTASNEADSARAKAESAAQEARRRLAAEKDASRRLQRQLAAITAERDEARATASAKDASLRRETSRVAQLETETKKAQADARTARKNLKVATGQLNELRTASTSAAARAQSAEANSVELDTARRKWATTEKKLESKIRRLDADLTSAKTESDRVAAELRAATAQVNRLQASHTGQLSSIKSLQSKNKQLESAVAQSTESTERAQKDLKASVKKLEDLKAKETKEAKEHKADSTELARLKADGITLQSRIRDLETENTRLNELVLQQSSYCEELKTATGRIAELEVEAAAHRATVSALEMERASTIKAHEEEIVMLRSELELTEDELKDKTTQLEAASAKLENRSTEDGEIAAELNKMKADLTAKSERITELEGEVSRHVSDSKSTSSLNAELSASSERVRALESDLENMQKQESVLKSTIKELETNRQALDGVRASLQQTADAAHDKEVSMRSDLATAESKIADLKKEVSHLRACESATEENQSQIVTLERQVASLNETLESANDRQSETEKRALTAEASIETLRAELATLQQAASLRSQSSESFDQTASGDARKDMENQLTAANAEITTLKTALQAARQEAEMGREDAAASAAQLATQKNEVERVRNRLEALEVTNTDEQTKYSLLNKKCMSLELELAEERHKNTACEANLKTAVDQVRKFQSETKDVPNNDTIQMSSRTEITTPTRNRAPASPKSPENTISPSSVAVDALIRAFLGSPKNGMCVAKYDSPIGAPDADEDILPFSVGNILALGGGEPDGFFLGTSIHDDGDGGNRLVPSNYVQLLDEDDACEKVSESVRGGKVTIAQLTRALELAESAEFSDDEYVDAEEADEVLATLAVALFDYEPPPGTGDLTFRTGQVLLLHGELKEDGFFDGEREGETGTVPHNFVALLSADDLDAKADPVRCTTIASGETLHIPRSQFDFGSTDELLVDFARD